MPITIAVDAMGSDKAPLPEIEGALQAARHYDVRVLLIGKQDVLREHLGAHAHAGKFPVEVVHASEVISMKDKAAQAVRSKRDSSMRVGLRLVREGKAAAFVTAGNTGAAMATAKMVLGTLPGVDRPALATVFPTEKRTASILLDVGANVDCKPENLQQFAIMGEVYFRTIFAGKLATARAPRVGLLSIGEEETKGNELTREAFKLIKTLSLNFVGNVEGRDLFNGHGDVAVCDGFVGNVALKSIEGTAQLLSASLRQSLKSTVTSQVGALLSRKAFNEFKKRLDYSEYGGAVLLGVRGACIIGHGSSNEKAIMNGVRVAAEFAQAEVNSGIETALRPS
jgi:glycerol-3-phosphate acyltransferase PlsX